jgi:hypothetical protein
MALVISTIDVIVSAVFTVLVARQWLSSRKTHQLLWTAALFVWTLAVLAETASAIRGRWDPVSYRIYYAFGALMVASWLGAGTLFLIAPRRLAVGFFFVTALLSVAGTGLILTHPIDPAQLAQTDALGFVEVKAFHFIPVRILIVIANILGTLAFRLSKPAAPAYDRGPFDRPGGSGGGLGPFDRRARRAGPLPGERADGRCADLRRLPAQHATLGPNPFAGVKGPDAGDWSCMVGVCVRGGASGA